MTPGQAHVAFDTTADPQRREHPLHERSTSLPARVYLCGQVAMNDRQAAMALAARAFWNQ